MAGTLTIVLGVGDGLGDGLSMAGQVASGAHSLVPLRAQRVVRLMDPSASNARTLAPVNGPRGFLSIKR